jgi:aspartate aminotransferase-like enzyme
VTHLEFEYDQPLDVEKIEQVLSQTKPKLLTAVHCETPSGVTNHSLQQIGKIDFICFILFIFF